MRGNIPVNLSAQIDVLLFLARKDKEEGIPRAETAGTQARLLSFQEGDNWES